MIIIMSYMYMYLTIKQLKLLQLDEGLSMYYIRMLEILHISPLFTGEMFVMQKILAMRLKVVPQ